MSVLPYHKRYHSDALAGMMPLTLEERGAYNTLLDLMYDRSGPLIDNERLLAGYMNCSVRKWRQLREILIAKGKISINRDGMICNSRARKEIENQSKTRRKLIESGSKGGRTRAENEKKVNEISESDQASLEPPLENPSSIRARSRSQKLESSEDKSSAGKPAPNDHDPIKEMFDLGVSILADAGTSEKRARSLIGKWRKASGEAKVIEALLDCRARSISEPVEWLEKRFNGAAYVSKSGYEYRGDIRAVIREAERRADWDTYWRAKGDFDAASSSSAAGCENLAARRETTRDERRSVATAAAAAERNQ